MNHSGVPMLTDFGQSRVSNYSMSALKTTAYDNVKGTAHWMAYELLGFIDSADSQVICTKESDMWAFGMVIYVGGSNLVLRSSLMPLHPQGNNFWAIALCACDS